MYSGLKVVVVLPAYNAEQTLEQTYRELIGVPACCTWVSVQAALIVSGKKPRSRVRILVYELIYLEANLMYDWDQVEFYIRQEWLDRFTS